MNRFIALLATLVAVASCAHAVPGATGDWLELIDVTRLPYLRTDATSLVSTFDRAGGNDDGFSGKYSAIRKEGENLVIFEAKGPGCIYRIWSATLAGNRLKFYFDGEASPRIDMPFDELLTGKRAPFVPPVAQHMLGGGCSYVPIPFAKSCKVVLEGPWSFGGQPTLFYHFTWTKFAADRQVKTFSPSMTEAEQTEFDAVRKAWSNLGASPWPRPSNALSARRKVTIPAGGAAVVNTMGGAGIVRELRMRVAGSGKNVLRRTIVKVNVDGMEKPSVWSPIGDLFLDGFGAGRSKALLLGKDNGAYYCYYPMPYSGGYTLSIENKSSRPVTVESELVWERMDQLPDGMGRFYAWWHRQNPTTPGKPFPILDIHGRGHWCGVSHAMQGTGGHGFLEGDETASIDGRNSDDYNGTGSEDYFNSGWYFGGVGNAPMHGCGLHDEPGSRCLAYRMHMTDAVPFQSEAHIGIEHGAENTYSADYAGVTYWYAEPSSTHGFEPADSSALDPQSVRLLGCLEAEDLAAGLDVVTDTDRPYSFSGGKAVAGPSIDLSVEVPCAGRYNVQAQMAGEAGDRVKVLVDGVNVGEARIGQDLLALSTVGSTPLLSKGKHTIGFRSTRGVLALDCLRLTPAARPIELEKCKILGAYGGPVGPQDWMGLSGGQHLFFRPSRPGARFRVQFPVAEAGTYALSAAMTRASDYGVVTVKLDGAPIGQPFDGFSPVVGTGVVFDLGSVSLTSGDHELEFTVTGKSPNSVGYYAGADCIRLER